MKTVYLIRHGAPAYPDGKRMCMGGRVDLPLSPLGMAQAERLARAFEGARLDAVFSSPMRRARQTAASIAGGRLPLRVLPELTEMDGGEWDGLTFDEIHARYPAYFGVDQAHAVPPGGESDGHGLARMLEALRLIEAGMGERAAVVAHAGVNRILLCSLMGLPLERKKTLDQPCACVNVLRRDGDGWRVLEAGVPLEDWAIR